MYITSHDLREYVADGENTFWFAVIVLLLSSVLEPQKEILRKPTKKVLDAFIVVWGAVLRFIVVVFSWNALRWPAPLGTEANFSDYGCVYQTM